jgi:Integron cassette protein VCH_CASS1 chain
MTQEVDSVNTLKVYIKEVVEKAEHHAGNVNHVVLVLAGAILWKKDEGAELAIGTYLGRRVNMLWVKINGILYAFSYNYRDQQIVMKKGGKFGDVIHRFDNETPMGLIYQIFSKL